MERYVALIADMKQSRKIALDKRNQLQCLVLDTLEYLNGFFAEGIEKRVMFSGGDEIQGLFRDPVTASLYFRMLGLVVGFDVFRGGIGLGSWDVRLEDQASTFQDGSAYHRARSAIAEAKKSKHYDAVVCADSQDDRLTVLLDHSLGICKMRTDIQNETALVVELLLPLTSGGKGSHCSHSQSMDTGLRMLNRRVELQEGEGLRTGLVASILDKGDACEIFQTTRHTILNLFWKEDAFSMLEGDLVGCSYELSRISGMSRQGIDRQLSRGRVVQERNAAALFAFTLTRQWG